MKSNASIRNTRKGLQSQMILGVSRRLAHTASQPPSTGLGRSCSEANVSQLSRAMAMGLRKDGLYGSPPLPRTDKEGTGFTSPLSRSASAGSLVQR